jgi:RHH-type transcriptional regulator, rel operon repressor / antitoxin RelB
MEPTDVTDVQAREAQTDLTLRLPAQLVARLEAFASLTGGSASNLVEEALIPFLDYEEWKYASIAEAVKEADAGGPFIAHERIVAWVESWGTDNELPPPE